MNNQTLVAGQNQNPYTGHEQVIHHSGLAGLPGVKAYKDNFGAIRLVYRDVSGLLLEKDKQGAGYTIKAVWTAPIARRCGFARCLLWAARNVLGLDVRHSDCLTEDGLNWALSVG